MLGVRSLVVVLRVIVDRGVIPQDHTAMTGTCKWMLVRRLAGEVDVIPSTTSKKQCLPLNLTNARH